MKILGYRKVSGTSKNTGNAFSGINLYVSYDLKGVEGVACERIYVSDSVLNESVFVPVVGAEIEVSYNRFGTVFAVREVA